MEIITGTVKSCLLAEPRLAIGIATFLAVLMLRLSI